MVYNQPCQPRFSFFCALADKSTFYLSLVTWAWKGFLNKYSVKLATNQYAMLNKVGK